MAESVTEEFERTMQNRHVVGGSEVAPSGIGTRSCCPTVSTGERFLPPCAWVVSNLPTLAERTLYISSTAWVGVLHSSFDRTMSTVTMSCDCFDTNPMFPESLVTSGYHHLPVESKER